MHRRGPVPPPFRAPHAALFSVLVSGVLLVLPLARLLSVHRGYSLPRQLLALLAGAIAGWILADLALRRHPRAWGIRPSFALLLLVHLAALALPTFLRGRDLEMGLLGSFDQLLGLSTHLAAAVLALAAQAAAGSETRFRWLLRALAGSGVLVLLMGPCRQENEPWRWTGTFGHANYTASVLLLPLFAALGLALGPGRKWERIAWAAAAAGMGVELFLLETRGAWVGAACGLLVLAFLATWGPLAFQGAARRRSRLGALGAGLIIAIALAAVLSVPSWRGAAGERVAGILRVEQGSSSRLEVWRASPPFFREHGLLGVGAEGFRNAFLPYKTEALARSTGREQFQNLHSFPLQALAEGGVAGLAAFLGLVWLSLRSLLRRIGDASIDRRDRWVSAGLLAGLVAHLVHGLAIGHIASSLVFGWVAIGAAAGCPSGAASLSRDPAPPRTGGFRRWGSIAAAVLGLALLGAVLIHGVRLLRADRALLLGLTAGAWMERGGGQAALDSLIREGAHAAELAPRVGEYRYLLATAIADALERAPSIAETARRRALELALSQAGRAEPMEKRENRHLLLARLHYRLGSLELAEEEVRRSIAVDGRFWQSRRILALLLIHAGRLEEARREAEAVARLDPTGEDAARLRALIEESPGQTQSHPGQVRQPVEPQRGQQPP